MSKSEVRNVFSDNPIVECTSTRLKQKDRKSKLHYYSVRSDDDSVVPSTLEFGVWANHVYDLAVAKPIAEMDEGGGFIELTDHEIESIEAFGSVY